jgi:hypothetical protein
MRIPAAEFPDLVEMDLGLPPKKETPRPNGRGVGTEKIGSDS